MIMILSQSKWLWPYGPVTFLEKCHKVTCLHNLLTNTFIWSDSGITLHDQHEASVMFLECSKKCMLEELTILYV